MNVRFGVVCFLRFSVNERICELVKCCVKRRIGVVRDRFLGGFIFMEI